MEKAIPSQPTSAVDAQAVPPAPLRPLTGLALEMATAFRLSQGISESLLDLASGDGEIVDAKRWQLFLAMLASADHELGRAVR